MLKKVHQQLGKEEYEAHISFVLRVVMRVLDEAKERLNQAWYDRAILGLEVLKEFVIDAFVVPKGK